MPAGQHVSAFGMNKPVDQFALCIHTHSDTCPDCIIDAAVQSLSRAPLHLSKGSSIHIRIESDRHWEMPFHITHEIKACPAPLGRSGHMPVQGAGKIHIQRPERTDPDSHSPCILKISNRLLHGLLWSLRRKADPVQNFTFLITYSADEFCAACFNRPNDHDLFSSWQERMPSPF
ncbi:hypothetical protein D3C73_1194220 [compost metagenome]